MSVTTILLKIADAIIEAIRAAGPLGCPAGVLYAALMPHGCSLAQFESIMAGLIAAGKVADKGGCYFAV